MTAIYYSLTQRNTSAAPVVARLSSAFETPVLLEQGDYRATVIRFDVPFAGVPLLRVPVAPNQTMPLLQLTIRRASDGASQTATITPDATFTESPDIYSAQVFVQLVDAALGRAIAQFAPAPTSPVLLFNESTGVLSMTAKLTDWEQNGAGAFSLAFNAALAGRLAGFPYRVVNGACFPQFMAMAGGGNVSAGVATIYSQGWEIDGLSDIEGLSLETSLAVRQEWSGEGAIAPILETYVLNDLDLKTFHNRAVYTTTGAPYRQIDVQGSGALMNIECYVYVTRLDGTRAPLMLPPGTAASVRLMFRPKATDPY